MTDAVEEDTSYHAYVARRLLKRHVQRDLLVMAIKQELDAAFERGQQDVRRGFREQLGLE